MALIFEIENLGRIKTGSFEERPLTIFCGPNNSGKTWTLYSLYYFHKYWLDIITGRSIEKGHIVKKQDSISETKKFNRELSYRLHEALNASPAQLREAKFNLKTDLKRLSFEDSMSITELLLLPAERNGLHLFFRELSRRRTALLHLASKDDIDLANLLRNVISSPYALPIADYIDWLNSIGEKLSNHPLGYQNFAQQLETNLAKGTYHIDAITNKIEFKPSQFEQDSEYTPLINLHQASGAVKSLFGLWAGLKYKLKKKSLLMIDEPELNIHPENQRKLARIFAKLVNTGLKVIISTHSDYLIHEFNTLIMLSEDKDKTLRKEYGYEDDEILNTKQIGAYLFDNQTITPFEISPEDGIYATTFDEVIKNLNEVNNDIYYRLQMKKDEYEPNTNY